MADVLSDSAPPKVNWRVALSCTVLLTVLFAIQQWTSGPNQPSFLVSVERQTVIWFTWLLLLPAVIAVARRYPVLGAPPKRWLLKQFGLSLLFSATHSILV